MLLWLLGGELDGPVDLRAGETLAPDGRRAALTRWTERGGPPLALGGLGPPTALGGRERVHGVFPNVLLALAEADDEGGGEEDLGHGEDGDEGEGVAEEEVRGEGGDEGVLRQWRGQRWAWGE